MGLLPTMILPLQLKTFGIESTRRCATPWRTTFNQSLLLSVLTSLGLILLWKNLSGRKKKAYKTAKKTSSALDWQYYKELKKLGQFDCRKRYHSFLNNMVCEDFSLNPKKFWDFIKGKKSDNTGVAPLKRNGIAHSNSKTKVQILNQQFTSVFTSEDTDYLPNLGPSPYPDLANIKVHVQGVVKLLKNINPHKATGPDNLPSRLLKEVADEIVPSLTLHLQATLTQDCIPCVWKEGLITPVFKTGDKSITSNYRPISLTSICCKLQEHIIHSNIMAHLDKHKILSDDQHGFRKRRSCETQLIIPLNDLAKGLNSKQQSNAVLLDFSKAFDRVPHQRLLLKLHFYGIRGEVLQWIRAFWPYSACLDRRTVFQHFIGYIWCAPGHSPGHSVVHGLY